MEYKDFIKKHEKYLPGYHDKYPKKRCKTCLYAVRVGCGTKLVEGRRTHFDWYGCELKKCKHDN